jgi:signal transduction histidine kinase
MVRPDLVLDYSSDTQRYIDYLVIFFELVLSIYIVFLASKEAYTYEQQLVVTQNIELSEKKLELEALNAKLDESNRAKVKLFAIVSHDLKSPLASLAGILDMLDRDDINEADFKTTITRLKHKNKKLLGLIDNLLAWSLSQVEHILPEPCIFDIGQIVQNEIQICSDQAAVKLISIDHTSSRLWVYADPNQMGIVVRNLLSNALRYSPKNGRVKVDILAGSGCVHVSIADNGPGLDVAMMRALHDSNFDNQRGTGLGLIICREFIEKNNGHLSINSSKGCGTAITFSIPVTDKNETDQLN